MLKLACEGIVTRMAADPNLLALGVKTLDSALHNVHPWAGYAGGLVLSNLGKMEMTVVLSSCSCCGD